MKLFLMTFLSLIFVVISGSATAQTIPSSDWYVTVYEPTTDTLHWVNMDGEQTSISRPRMPQETSYLDMRISPNGRYMVMTALLSNGRVGLGIYDFQLGQFMQTHTAELDEQIDLGGDYIFTSDSSLFAVGLFSGDFAAPAWRVILFESATGNARAFIDHTYPDAPDVGLAAPKVQYLTDTSVHLQFQPQAVGGSHTLPAYEWTVVGFDPEIPLISESNFIYTSADILLTSGQFVMAAMNENAGALAPSGPMPNFNSITNANVDSDTLNPLYTDPTRYHLDARWAKDGEWVLFLSSDENNDQYWNIMDTQEAMPLPLDAQFGEAYGTSTGYLLVDADRNLLSFDEMTPLSATRIYQLSEQSQIIYITPLGTASTLTTIAEPDNPVANTDPTPTLVVNDAANDNDDPPSANTCDSALTQRVVIGSQARVTPSVTALNLRDQPAGNIINTFGGGQIFDVIGGAVCADEVYWWQIQSASGNGWLAESNFQNYYIEPFDGVVVEPEPPTPNPDPPSEGAPDEIAPNPDPPSPTPQNLILVLGCETDPLVPRVTVGSNVTATVTLPVLASPNAGPDSTQWELPAGRTVDVIGGYQCGSGGLVTWQVSGFLLNKTTGLLEQATGWVWEGSGDTYWLSPS